MVSGMKAFIASIMIMLAFISIGIWERLLWVSSGIYIWNQLKHLKKQSIKQMQILLGGIVMGYIVMMILLGIWQYSIEVQHSVEVRHPMVHHVPSENVGVILLFEGESATYELPVVLRKIREEEGLLSQAFLPLHLFREKIRYEKVERGSHVIQSQKIQGKLKEQISSEHNLYVSYQNHPPFFEEVVFEAIKLGHSKLLIVPVILSENEGFLQTTDFVRNLNLMQEGIQIKTTYPLWDSDLMAQSFLQQVLNQTQSQRQDNIGVILLGEELGQGREGLQYVKQDLLFRQKVKDLMINEGFQLGRIRFSGLDGKHIEREMEKLMTYGVREMVILQTAHLDDEGTSRLVVEKASKKAQVPYTVNIRHIIGFEGNEFLVRELQQRIHLVTLQSW
ncbi:hypothetical protein Amet_2893 [Alkaliphilus metalliredigens QYMF]|uniref:Uncharacterized protein n=1 Tax=Alkaliphilus metalliredigens (strain QYMF) TaxID=293826 RepID=A6TS75_ALKMQ|nr:hypothetical protein [Alkaliphilus metalliredigens]ABR49043.1 hypothetical protein Amet_2893 [Alkaliphilus metalliredigens QYMF]